MSKLIDQTMVDNIRTEGCSIGKADDRIKILEKYNLPYDQKAENIIITGCVIISLLPKVIKSLTNIFHKKGLSYSFLSKEYCCGNYLYRPAIKARDQTALKECQNLSKDFIKKNIEQAKKLGAKRLIIFCSPCYPIYKHAFPDENIIFYPEALYEVMETYKFNNSIDYYAGCYRLHKRFSPAPMDLKSTNKVFSKLEGLKINRISAPVCCYKPKGLQHMIGHVKTKQMVHICTGCYSQALKMKRKIKDVEILMLPELIERIISKN
jgi:hypothetical protein